MARRYQIGKGRKLGKFTGDKGRIRLPTDSPGFSPVGSRRLKTQQFFGMPERSERSRSPMDANGFESKIGAGINPNLSSYVHDFPMRVATAFIVALLTLNFVDEQDNGGRYSRAETMILSQITRSFA